jgi:hypothetical protein
MWPRIAPSTQETGMTVRIIPLDTHEGHEHAGLPFSGEIATITTDSVMLDGDEVLRFVPDVVVPGSGHDWAGYGSNGLGTFVWTGFRVDIER